MSNRVPAAWRAYIINAPVERIHYPLVPGCFAAASAPIVWEECVVMPGSWRRESAPSPISEARRCSGSDDV